MFDPLLSEVKLLDPGEKLPPSAAYAPTSATTYATGPFWGFFSPSARLTLPTAAYFATMACPVFQLVPPLSLTKGIFAALEESHLQDRGIPLLCRPAILGRELRDTNDLRRESGFSDLRNRPVT